MQVSRPRQRSRTAEPEVGRPGGAHRGPARTIWRFPALLAIPLLTAGVVSRVALAEEESGAPAETQAPPEGAAKAEVTSVFLDPGKTAPGEGRMISIVLAPVNDARRRAIPFAVSVGAATKEASVEAARAVGEIEPLYSARAELYRAWALGELGASRRARRSGVLEVSELASRLELACPREVVAGEPIVLHAKSVGEADADWRACLVYPDGSRYECIPLSIGKKLPGTEKGRVNVLQFKTFPADAGSLLGVRVERSERAEDGWTFWVEVRKP